MDKSLEIYVNEGNEFTLFDKKQTKGEIKSKFLSKLIMEVEEIFGKA